MEFRKAKVVSLKAHPVLNEKWLQGLLADDPSLLGLGDNLILKDAERRQPRAGRLDLLFYDPEATTRYEVEVQLGPTDEAHIIRTIEYWDLERSRYPQYEHVAVLVAEDVTSRFLNVISLFNKAIPIVAVQMRALEIGDGVVTLSATTVLDLARLGTDEEDDAGQATDRTYWTDKGSPATVALADEMLGIVNDVTGRGLGLKYNKFYVGLAKDGIPDNFVVFRPRKRHILAEFKVKQTDEVSALVEGAGIEDYSYTSRNGNLVISLDNKAAVAKHRALITDLIRRASGTPAPTED
ncbi:hypothetical protein ACI797_24710 [Geodermatophilus sp. SYSU D00691]